MVAPVGKVTLVLDDLRRLSGKAVSDDDRGYRTGRAVHPRVLRKRPDRPGRDEQGSPAAPGSDCR